MSEQPTIRVGVDLGNATQQVNAFDLALARVNQTARGIFSTLSTLSQQYQQQGFLGEADQRTLERGLRRWQQASDVLGLQRRGAEARVQEATLGGGLVPTRGDALRITQAQGVLDRLREQQRGMLT